MPLQISMTPLDTGSWERPRQPLNREMLTELLNVVGLSIRVLLQLLLQNNAV